MKRYLICGAIALLSALLIAGCTERPSSSENPEESLGGSESVASASSLTDSEAASLNASITGADITLVQFEELKAGDQRAVIHTTMGDIELILFPKQAPKTVENFVAHAKNGYYNGLTFDKVLRNFILEGGDPDGKGGGSALGGTDGKPGYVANEFSLDLWHFRGAVSMSGVKGEDGNGSRFFIVQAPFVDVETLDAMKKINYPDKVLEKYEETGGAPGFDSKRTVFGMVTEEGLKVVDAIARVDVDSDGTPEETVLIESIDIHTVTAADLTGKESDGESEPGSGAS